MNVNAIGVVQNVNVNASNQLKKVEKQQIQYQTAPQENLAAPSAELLRANAGVKAPKDKDPYGARAFLNNHPASDVVKGEYRENLIHAMEKGNVETSNIEMQLALIADGKLHPQTMADYWKDGKMCDQMEADIDMMYDCYANGKSIEDTYVPPVTSQAEGIKNTKVGDVFQVEGQDMIYVKDGEDSSHQLKVDKETFMELFPPAQRFACNQYAIGDCYCVSTLNTVMEDPHARVALYDAFEQDGDDIHVKYPNGKADYVAHKGQLDSSTNPKMIMRGAQGMRLLEDAFGLELQVKAEDDFRTIMKEKIAAKKAEYQAESDPREKAIMKKDWNGMRQRLADFEESMANPKNKTVVLRDDTGIDIKYQEDRYGMKFSALKTAPDAKEFTTQKEYYRGSLGGYQHQVMDVLGFEGKCLDSVQDKQALHELIQEPSAGKYMLAAGTWPDGSRTEQPVAKDKGVFSFHAYTLESVKNEDGEVRVRSTNPWNTGLDADLTEKEMFEFFQFVEVYDVHGYKGINRQDAKEA